MAEKKDQTKQAAVTPVDDVAPVVEGVNKVPDMSGKKFHIDLYEILYGPLPDAVRPGMVSIHGNEMHTREEWAAMIEHELNRTIT